MHRRPPHLLLAVLALLAGCAWAPGEPVTTVDGRLSARLDTAGRAETGGWRRLASDFELRLETVRLRTGDVSLQRLAAAGGGGAFDPANPPAGYACHGGHCHTPDGRNLSYAEVAAELSGGGGHLTLATLVSPEDERDLLGEDEPVTLGCGDCALDHGSVSRVLTALEAMSVSGRVRDTRASPRFDGERTFAFELPPEDAPLSLSTPLALESDRFSPARVSLSLSLSLSVAHFDAVDWAALEAEPADHLPLDSEANHEALDALLERFARSALQAEASSAPFAPY